MMDVINIKTIPDELTTGDLMVHDGRLWMVDDVEYNRSTMMTTVHLSDAVTKITVPYPSWAESTITRVRVFQRPS